MQYITSTLLLLILLSFYIIKNDAAILLNDRVVGFMKYREIIPLPNNTLTLVNYKTYPNVTGKLVYVDFPLYTNQVFLLPFMDTLRQLMESGAVGVVTCNTGERRQFGYYCIGSYDDKVPITAGFISHDSYIYFMNSGGIANFTFESWDINPWETMYYGPGLIVYEVIFVILFTLNMGLCVYKLIKWKLKRGKLNLSIGIICIFLEGIANLCRVVQTIVFPTYNIFSLVGYDISLSVAFCFSLISGILVIFFWFDVTLDPFFHKDGKGLGFMRIPAIVVITLLLLIEVTLDLVKNFIKFDVMVGVLSTYTVLHIIIAVFYFVAGWRILGLSKSSNVKEKLTKITYRILWSGVAAIASAITMCLLSTMVTYTPAALLVDASLTNVCLFLQSFLIISIFSPPKKGKTAKSSSKTPVPASIAMVSSNYNQ